MTFAAAAAGPEGPLAGADGRELGVSAGAPVAAAIDVTVDDGVVVEELRFDAAAGGPYPGSEVRRIVAARNLGPGTHRVELRWDGRDDAGAPVPAGRYRIFGTARTTTTATGPCHDGRPRESWIAAGMGVLRVAG